ncbi:hypothetical protein [Brevundimonas diminuta]|uniref:hypothetical protein n=1 Tax=Brevundimonas diminuta TaxID=293 RepID=UPI003CFCDE43
MKRQVSHSFEELLRQQRLERHETEFQTGEPCDELIPIVLALARLDAQRLARERAFMERHAAIDGEVAA